MFDSQCGKRMDDEVLRDALHTRQIDSNISKVLYT